MRERHAERNRKREIEMESERPQSYLGHSGGKR